MSVRDLSQFDGLDARTSSLWRRKYAEKLGFEPGVKENE